MMDCDCDNEHTLLQLQDSFQDYILGRDNRALRRVESARGVSAERRLDIYHNAYRARLIELLADTYERLLFYIGDANFDAAARAYIETHTPIGRNLRDYGADFPAFLGWRYPDDPEVAELAEMDQRLRNAFDAADAPSLCPEDLAAIAPDAWEGMVFATHPSASLQTFRFNTPAIWQRLNEETAPPPAERLPQAVTWLFWRIELQPHFRSLSPEETTALSAIFAGRPFGEVCASVAQAHPAVDAAQAVGLCLRTCLVDGVLRKP